MRDLLEAFVGLLVVAVLMFAASAVAGLVIGVATVFYTVARQAFGAGG